MQSHKSDPNVSQSLRGTEMTVFMTCRNFSAFLPFYSIIPVFLLYFKTLRAEIPPAKLFRSVTPASTSNTASLCLLAKITLIMEPALSCQRIRTDSQPSVRHQTFHAY